MGCILRVVKYGVAGGNQPYTIYILVKYESTLPFTIWGMYGIDCNTGFPRTFVIVTRAELFKAKN